MNGWNGSVVDINLTNRETKTYALDMDMAQQFLGGRGLGGRLL